MMRLNVHVGFRVTAVYRLLVLVSIAFAVLTLATGRYGHSAQAQTLTAPAQKLLVEHFDDSDAAPSGWTVLFAMSATPTPVPAAPAPTLSSPLVAVLVLLLTGLGTWLLMRRDRRDARDA